MRIHRLLISSLFITTLCLPDAALAKATLKGGEAPAIKDARGAFFEVLAAVQKDYVDDDLSADKLWSGAVRGMLDQLIQLESTRVNTVLSPVELEELQIGVKGALSGVGVVIEKMEDVLVVKEALEGAPAAAAGIVRGDRILEVDGVAVKDRDLIDIIGQIRGPTGTTVDLFVQRGAKEWTVPVTRGRIILKTVYEAWPSPDAAYIRLTAFNEGMPKKLEEALRRIAKKDPKGLVLDLRGSSGGLFESTLAVADLFMNEGETIVAVKRRQGGSQIHKSRTASILKTVPIVVLIGKHTASGAEMLAAALADNGHATLVGQRTLGKGTVEKVVRLKNGWGLKLSVGRFETSKGRSWLQTGIEPDFAVGTEKEESRGYSVTFEPDIETDSALRAGLKVLQYR